MLTPEQALSRLEGICSRSEHCTHELLTKLRSWGIASDDSARIIDSLRENRYVDDTRFARAFARDRIEYSGYGHRRVAMSLAQKRIPSDIIRVAIEEAVEPDRYTEIADRVLMRYARRLEELESWESRNKLYRHGCSRGFESEVVKQSMRRVILMLRDECVE